MQKPDQAETILQNIRQGAFVVTDNAITAVNTAAAQRFAKVGMGTDQFLTTGAEEYEAFHDGSLYLTICLSGTEYPCYVTALQEGHLFVMEEATAQAELQVLSLASMQLNMPISEISLLVDRLSADIDEKTKINQNLFRIRRILSNMADAARLTVSEPRLTGCEICSIFEETLEKASAMLSQDGIVLNYRLPNHAISCCASAELLRRAIYNLISNAVKFSPAGSAIEATLNHKDKRLYFSVTSSCDSMSVLAEGNFFNRYTRQPGLEDPRLGLGLGMSLVRAAAAAHGGTVLVEKLSGKKIRITMSLSIIPVSNENIRSPILIPDIYCGSDQALIELSDVLSNHFYKEL